MNQNLKKEKKSKILKHEYFTRCSEGCLQMSEFFKENKRKLLSYDGLRLQ